MINLTLPTNNLSNSCSIFVPPVTNSNSSSEIFKICAFGIISNIASLNLSGAFHNGSLTFKSKLTIPLLFNVYSIALSCACFIGKSPIEIEQK